MNIGSEGDQTTIYFINKEKTNVVCGCFVGTLLEFKKRVDEVYPDGDGMFGEQYRKFIQTAEACISELT